MKSTFFTLAFLCLFVNSLKAETNWLSSFDQAQKIALASNKLILVDFWATWCGPCRKMDKDAWSKDEVGLLMKNFVPVKIDIDKNKTLARKYGVNGIPYVFILDGNGKVIYQDMSYKGKNEVVKLLKKYTFNTEYLKTDLINYFQKESYATALRLGVKYQEYSLHVDNDLKNDFLNVSSEYLRESESFLDDSSLKIKDKLKEKIELQNINKYLILSKFSKAERLLQKINIDGLAKMNVKTYNFLSYIIHVYNGNATEVDRLSLLVSDKDKNKAKLYFKV